VEGRRATAAKGRWCDLLGPPASPVRAMVPALPTHGQRFCCLVAGGIGAVYEWPRWCGPPGCRLCSVTVRKTTRSRWVDVAGIIRRILRTGVSQKLSRSRVVRRGVRSPPSGRDRHCDRPRIVGGVGRRRVLRGKSTITAMTRCRDSLGSPREDAAVADDSARAVAAGPQRGC